MIGLVIVAHGGLADEYKKVTEHVMGTQAQFEALGVQSDGCLQSQKAELLQLIDTVDDGDGVLIVVDLLGATPCNLAIDTIEREDVKLVTGANMPMLAKLINVRELIRLEELSMQAQLAGRKHIYTCQEICCRLKQLDEKVSL